MLKERHPETYTLNAIRQGAKKRGIPFTITLEEWKDFCKRTCYLDLRGTEPDSYTVDRINDAQGYHIWNIRILTHAENCADQYRNFSHGEERDFAEREEAEDFHGHGDDGGDCTPAEGQPF
jgi:hypothetical protein